MICYIISFVSADCIIFGNAKYDLNKKQLDNLSTELNDKKYLWSWNHQ